MPTINPDGTVNSSPPVNFDAVTLDDATDFTMDGLKGSTNWARGFITNMDGDLSVLDLQDQVISIPVVRGYQYAGVVKRFRTTGTTLGMLVLALS